MNLQISIKDISNEINRLQSDTSIMFNDASEYSTGSSLKISLPSQEIVEHIKFVEGVRCYLIGGAHVGGFANMTAYEVKRSSMANEVQFEDFGTVAANVFAVGDATLPNTEVVE